MTSNTNAEIIVSICCIAYNQEKYISQAIDGFLFQKTDFDFEILIHDDASTDNTAQIIQSYQAKYPLLIKPIYQTDNQFSKGIKINPNFNFPRAKGKYIALCDGDDYWTDPYKLQKQVDFLNKEPDCFLVFHPVGFYDDMESKLEYKYTLNPPSNKNKFDLPELLAKGPFIHLSSVLIKNKFEMIFPDWINRFPYFDFALWVICGLQGKFGFINEEMSVYRINPTGIHGSLNFKTKIEMDYSACRILRENLPSKYHPFIRKRILRLGNAARKHYYINKSNNLITSARYLLLALRLNPYGTVRYMAKRLILRI